MLNRLLVLSDIIPLPISPVLKLLMVLTLLLIVISVVVVLKVLPFIAKITAHKKAKELRTSGVFSSDIIENTTKWYCRQNCRTIVPSEHKMLEFNQSPPQDLYKTIHDLVNKSESRQYVLLMGELGLGKTSFCIYFYLRYLKQISRKHPIELFSLHDPECDSKIKTVRKKGKTIIILDAFDEDPHIFNDFSLRLKEIVDTAKDFFKIIIAGDPRLFQIESKAHASFTITQKEDFNLTKFIENTFLMVQILPFTQEQMLQYTSKKFKLTDRTKNRRAQQIIKKLPYLFSKPLMLQYMDTLVQKDISTKYSFEIFEEFVSLHLEEEIKTLPGVTCATLKTSYKVIAFTMINTVEGINSAALPMEKLKELGTKFSIDICGLCCTPKGLLKQVDNSITFIHPSIMEYLIAESILTGQYPDQGVELPHQIFLFLYEMIEKNNPFKNTQPPNPGLFRYLWSVGFDMNSLDLKNGNMVRTDFSGLNLVGLDLSGTDLQEAEFYNSTLKKITLSQSNLSNAHFRRVDAEEVNFTSCTCFSTQFVKCVFRKSNFIQANLSQVKINQCEFSEVDMSNADMSAIRIIDSTFLKVIFRNSSIQNGDLSQSDFQRCVFTKSNMVNAKLNQTTLAGCHLNECDLSRACLNNANMKYSIFNASNLMESTIIGSDLSGADLNYANLENSNMESSILHGVDLSKSNLTKANLSKVSMRKAILRGCQMPEIDFSSTMLSGIALNGVNLHGANFTNADLREADLRETDLRKANFTNANIKNSDLRVSDLAEAIVSFEQLVSLKSFDFARISLNLYKQIRVEWPKKQPKPMGVRHD